MKPNEKITPFSNSKNQKYIKLKLLYIKIWNERSC